MWLGTTLPLELAQNPSTSIVATLFLCEIGNISVLFCKRHFRKEGGPETPDLGYTYEQ